MAQNCEGCKYFLFTRKGTPVGECHKEPPKVFPMPTQFGGMESIAMWPPVNKDAWCGEFTSRTGLDTSTCQPHESCQSQSQEPMPESLIKLAPR